MKKSSQWILVLKALSLVGSVLGFFSFCAEQEEIRAMVNEAVNEKLDSIEEQKDDDVEETEEG